MSMDKESAILAGGVAAIIRQGLIIPTIRPCFGKWWAVLGLNQ
jgi:hypothetical protein